MSYTIKRTDGNVAYVAEHATPQNTDRSCSRV